MPKINSDGIASDATVPDPVDSDGNPVDAPAEPDEDASQDKEDSRLDVFRHSEQSDRTQKRTRR